MEGNSSADMMFFCCVFFLTQKVFRTNKWQIKSQANIIWKGLYGSTFSIRHALKCAFRIFKLCTVQPNTYSTLLSRQLQLENAQQMRICSKWIIQNVAKYKWSRRTKIKENYSFQNNSIFNSDGCATEKFMMCGDVQL